MIRTDWRNRNLTLIKKFACCPLCRHYFTSLALAQTWPQSCFLLWQTENIVFKLRLATKQIPSVLSRTISQGVGAQSCPLSSRNHMRSSPFFSLFRAHLPDFPSNLSRFWDPRASLLILPSSLALFGYGFWAIYFLTKWEISKMQPPEHIPWVP